MADDRSNLLFSASTWQHFFGFALFLFLVTTDCFAALAMTGEKVQFKTRDGLTLSGSFVAPQKGNPTLVMLHGASSVKEEWAPLVSTLTVKGWGSLTYDARGHGESSPTLLGDPGPGSAWDKMIDDVGVAVQFLEKKKNIDRKKIVLMGASLGANDVLNYAALTGFQAPLVLLSPGLSYRGVQTKTAVTKAKGPILIVTSTNDQYAYLSSIELVKLAPSITLWRDVNPGHGVQMFDATLINRILEWLRSN